LSRRRTGRDLEKVSLTINRELIAWVAELVKKGVFTSKSQGISLAVKLLRREYERTGSLPNLS